MQLPDYLAQPGAPSTSEFARACGVARSFLWQIAKGRKPCPPRAAVRIEVASGHVVRRWDLCPDWYEHWPELIGAEGAPEVGAIPSNPQPPTPQREAA